MPVASELLPEPLNTGEADQLVARQNEIDVLQIMFPCAFDDDVGHGRIVPENVGAAIGILQIRIPSGMHLSVERMQKNPAVLWIAVLRGTCIFPQSVLDSMQN
jgi:hypothetical protein